jgi:hypothetical protein
METKIKGMNNNNEKKIAKCKCMSNNDEVE